MSEFVEPFVFLNAFTLTTRTPQTGFTAIYLVSLCCLSNLWDVTKYFTSDVAQYPN